MVKHCDLCGKVAISWPAGSGPNGTDVFQKYIATRYCPSCAKERRRENAAWRQRKFRKRNPVSGLRREVAVAKERVDTLKECLEEEKRILALLRAENASLREELQKKPERRKGLLRW